MPKELKRGQGWRSKGAMELNLASPGQHGFDM